MTERRPGRPQARLRARPHSRLRARPHSRLGELKFLAVGVGTGLAAWFLLVGLMLSIAPIVTLPLLPRTARGARRLAAFERRRTGRYLDTTIPAPRPVGGDDIGDVLASPDTRRDVSWLALHATFGLLTGLLAVASPAGVVQNLVTAAFWPLLPSATTTLDQPVESWGGAGLALATAAGYGLFGAVLVPPLARWYARVSAARLAPPKPTLVERLAEVTATRAAALEAHGTELRRIERSLHDGTQNRIVAVVMHLGMVERALRRDPESALPMILTAQDAATDALSELREVVRQIYPPVLTDRGLRGAVAALAAHCAIPCALTADQELRRAPAAVEAAAYFVVAEALTNAVKHSGARQITVSLRTERDRLTVEVSDDGHGGADGTRGSGVVGIQRRVAAFDGTTLLHSPPGGPTVLRADIPLGV
ncbi:MULTISPECIES: sensor histidine kinase [unclassified Streptomyces]|uniref:sensor histidine kinase n=1 Tax=unclassified Streptomyces TaxID=2593676 RepID=UPI002E2AA1AE|nr:sensor domain-containing protein [Streptomyces sp. NBC_01429]